jgi:hypothetical protein
MTWQEKSVIDFLFFFVLTSADSKMIFTATSLSCMAVANCITIHSLSLSLSLYIYIYREREREREREDSHLCFDLLDEKFWFYSCIPFTANLPWARSFFFLPQEQ